MNAINVKKLVGERLTELGCGELPDAVRNRLDDAVASAWEVEATRLVAKIVTAKRVEIGRASCRERVLRLV